MADEAQAYLRQEAQHSAAHLSHIRALTRRWPGLRATSDAVIASYDRLVATKPLAWRLAYPAIVEATFTPYFKVLLDHEDKLFEPGDERVASMFIWHFCEEIEHRSSALRVYDARGRGFGYGVKAIGGVVKHMGEILDIISGGFQEHVPPEDGAISVGSSRKDYPSRRFANHTRLPASTGITAPPMPVCPGGRSCRC